MGIVASSDTGLLGVDTVSLFLALLAVVAEIATVTAVVLAVGGRFSPRLAARRDQAVEAVAPSSLTFAFLVAAVCTAGEKRPPTIRTTATAVPISATTARRARNSVTVWVFTPRSVSP